MLLRTSPSTSTGTLIIPDWKQAWVVTMILAVVAASTWENFP